MTDSPTLSNLLAAYFHQDWAMEFGSVEAVADYYRGSESPEQVEAARAELAALLDEGLDDAALGARLQALGCEYHPGDAGGWRGFAETLLSRLR